MKSKDFHGYTIYEDGTIIGLQGREIKKRVKDGRYEIRLNIGKKRRNFIVARLIYYLFYEDIPGNEPFDIQNQNQCITHKDGNKLNVHSSNLEMRWRKDLIQGERHTAITKLTDEQVAEIRALYKGKAGSNQTDKTGPSLKDLANHYGVSKSNIAVIISGRSRKPADYKLK